MNFHPATVHFPIAFLLLASFAALGYLYWQPRSLLLALTWMPMLLGWLGVAIAVLTGLLAQSGLPPVAPYRRLLNWHTSSGLVLLVIYGALLYQRWLHTSPRRNRRKALAQTPGDLLDQTAARRWITLLLLLGAIFVIVSGWSGGKLVYQWAVNVG